MLTFEDQKLRKIRIEIGAFNQYDCKNAMTKSDQTEMNKINHVGGTAGRSETNQSEANQLDGSVADKNNVDTAYGDSDTVSKETSETSKEINGPKGLEPTRYGDWESKGRCCDF